MKWKSGEKAVLKSKVQKNTFFNVVVLSPAYDGKYVRVTFLNDKTRVLEVTPKRLRPFTPLDEALS